MNRANHLAGFAAGILFGLGLGISRAARPDTIQGFLDFFGAWDPTLAVVMGAGAATYAVFYRVARGRLRPVLATAFTLPKTDRLDARLFAGAAMFGIGWGLAGVCPGPAVTTALWSPAVFAFACALVLGIAGFELLVAPRLAVQQPALTRAGNPN
jgi:hypothetical protein